MPPKSLEVRTLTYEFWRDGILLITIHVNAFYKKKGMINDIMIIKGLQKF